MFVSLGTDRKRLVWNRTEDSMCNMLIQNVLLRFEGLVKDEGGLMKLDIAKSYYPVQLSRRGARASRNPVDFECDEGHSSARTECACVINKVYFMFSNSQIKPYLDPSNYYP